MMKTLIYSIDDNVIAVLIRGDHDVNDEKLTQALGGKHAELADEETIEKTTSARVGFAGPVALDEKIEVLLSAVQGGKQLNITWEHHGDGKSHTFTVDSLRRTESKNEVILQWDGQTIDSEDQGENIIIILATSC